MWAVFSLFLVWVCAGVLFDFAACVAKVIKEVCTDARFGHSRVNTDRGLVVKLI
jgi:hypothetical protein